MSDQDPFVSTLHHALDLFTRITMGKFIRYIKEIGLSMSQMGALFQIYTHGNCGVTWIGEELGISSAAASQVLDRLVQQGLVHRLEDPSDRRGKLLTLTENGRRLVVDGIKVRQSVAHELAPLLTDDEKKQLVAAFEILIEKTGRLMPNPDTNIEPEHRGA
jgi:DNA-binding MarR family transcriptional regulator